MENMILDMLVGINIHKMCNLGNSTVTELQFTVFFNIHVCIGNSSLDPERKLE